MKNAYTTLFLYQELLDELKNSDRSKKDICHINNRIVELKRKIRAEIKRNNNLYYGPYDKPVGEITFGKWDFDGGWMKVFVKGEHWTDEEKREFIEDNWIYCRPSQYDCTGQVFTVGIDVFNVPNGVVIYIREGRDV